MAGHRRRSLHPRGKPSWIAGNGPERRTGSHCVLVQVEGFTSTQTTKARSPVDGPVASRWSSEIRFLHRVAGIGSLGRPRYVEVGSCNGGKIAREAKAWLPSAWSWARGRVKGHAYSVRMLKHAVRQPDPYYSVEAGWVVRR